MAEKRAIAMRNIIPLLIIPFLLICCSQEDSRINIRGKAQGTTYLISYYDTEERFFNQEIDSLLKQIDQSMSTYQKESVISKWNSNLQKNVDSHFLTVYEASRKVHHQSQGYFDPTVVPLLELYGFGNKKPGAIDKHSLDSVMTFIGLEKIHREEDRLYKDYPQIALNFNAIAQGYTVDIVRDFLRKKGIQSFMVEIGGELYCSGKKPEQQPWIIAIDRPQEERKSDFQAQIMVENNAVATSGNYRKFIIDENTGEKYVHTINPITAEARSSSLLSVTVVHEDCIYADAYATAIMSMGLEKGVSFIKNTPEIKAYLIYSNGDKYEWLSLNGFDEFLL
jgi:thiamine biosynthesis lipoprotein